MIDSIEEAAKERTINSKCEIHQIKEYQAVYLTESTDDGESQSRLFDDSAIILQAGEPVKALVFESNGNESDL